MTALWAATRDASCYDRPDVRTTKQVHMAREDGTARCNRSTLDEGSTWSPSDVPPGLRCRSNGCRQAWPTTPAPAAG
ncbi:hypothetical protein [Streptomyces griseus]|uniref:hypothetical protein n=1 Tax=Streptomyces griseus TaxID=1911 RepID=UPI000A3C299D|nr:hypothetical protein [Streptomyces fimicarius]